MKTKRRRNGRGFSLFEVIIAGVIVDGLLTNPSL
jgi:Tfp pilus assembly protein PilV